MVCLTVSRKKKKRSNRITIKQIQDSREKEYILRIIQRVHSQLYLKYNDSANAHAGLQMPVLKVIAAQSQCIHYRYMLRVS